VKRITGLLLGAAHLHAFNGRNRTPRASGFEAGKPAHPLTAFPTVVSRDGFFLDGVRSVPAMKKAARQSAERLDNLLLLCYSFSTKYSFAEVCFCIVRPIQKQVLSGWGTGNTHGAYFFCYRNFTR
jgi:hypothetical protein